MDYWEAITKRWRKLPTWLFKNRKDPLFLRAYYEARISEGGTYASYEHVLNTRDNLAKSLNLSEIIETQQANETPEVKVRYFAVVHFNTHKKIIGSYTSVAAALAARNRVVMAALRHGTAAQCEVDWFNHRN